MHMHHPFRSLGRNARQTTAQWYAFLMIRFSNCTTDEDQSKLKYVLWFSVIRAENPIPCMAGDGPADDGLIQGQFKTHKCTSTCKISIKTDLKRSGVHSN